MSSTSDPEKWHSVLVDPYRDRLLAACDNLPDLLPQLVQPLCGEPAFDPAWVASLAGRFRLPVGLRFPHPLLERAVRVGLAHIEATFQGDHPKYGVGQYAEPRHDSFPPTIIAAVDALTLWGMASRAEQLFSYWLNNFVREDGTIDYYGPSLSEYGQLLTTARRLMDRGGSKEWLHRHAPIIERLVHYLRDLIWDGSRHVLPRGVPEADERVQGATYFHNAAWIAAGLRDWGELLLDRLDEEEDSFFVLHDYARVSSVLEDALRQVWPRDPGDWWLRPMLEEEKDGYWARPEGGITANRLGSYTNYRYWPELLSSAILPRDLMQRIVYARLAGGGQFCGVTRFEDHLDDWPLMDHMEGLWTLGMRDDYLLSLWGHIRCHQAEGHLTAYEQVSFPPGRPVADYCLPCQLVAVRAAHRLVGNGS